jgi:3-oxoacyl-[acyl-carrier protein] reductase
MTAALPEKVRASLVERIPVGRLGAPDDVASAVCFLASDEAAYITGQVLAVNGGMYL